MRSDLPRFISSSFHSIQTNFIFKLVSIIISKANNLSSDEIEFSALKEKFVNIDGNKIRYFESGSSKKTLSSSGLEQMNAYGEMMKKFAETWNSMWPKTS